MATEMGDFLAWVVDLRQLAELANKYMNNILQGDGRMDVILYWGMMINNMGGIHMGTTIALYGMSHVL